MTQHYFSDYGLPVVPSVHLCWDGEEEAPRVSVLDALIAARAKLMAEMQAVASDPRPRYVMGTPYDTEEIAAEVRGRIQESLMARTSHLDTQIAHAMGAAA